MYPSLTPIGSYSQWHTKKQTPQEEAAEIQYLEERLEEKNLNEIQVHIPVLVHGEVVMPKRTTSLEKEEEEDQDAMSMEEHQEEREEPSDYQQQQSDDSSFFHSMYHGQSEEDDNNDNMPQRSPVFNDMYSDEQYFESP